MPLTRANKYNIDGNPPDKHKAVWNDGMYFGTASLPNRIISNGSPSVIEQFSFEFVTGGMMRMIKMEKLTIDVIITNNCIWLMR